MMMSALVLAPNARAGGDLERTREVVVRSLAWLVSAVVAGVIGDVVLAAPSLLDLGEAADLVGCRLVEANDEGDRLRQGAEACRKVRLLVMRAGFTADIGMVDELERFLRGFPDGAIIRATPESLLQTLMPRLAPVVGIVLSREKASRARAFDDLVRSTKGAPHLRSRAIRLA